MCSNCFNNYSALFNPKMRDFTVTSAYCMSRQKIRIDISLLICSIVTLSLTDDSHSPRQTVTLIAENKVLVPCVYSKTGVYRGKHFFLFLL